MTQLIEQTKIIITSKHGSKIHSTIGEASDKFDVDIWEVLNMIADNEEFQGCKIEFDNSFDDLLTDLHSLDHIDL